KIGVFEWRKANAEREVDTLFDDIDTAVSGFDIDADTRIAGKKPRQNISHITLHQRDGTGDTKTPAWFRLRAVYCILRGFRFGQHRRAVAIINLPDLRDGQSPRRTSGTCAAISPIASGRKQRHAKTTGASVRWRWSWRMRTASRPW